MLDDLVFAGANRVLASKSIEEIMDADAIRRQNTFCEGILSHNGKITPSIHPTSRTKAFWVYINQIQIDVDMTLRDIFDIDEFSVRKPKPLVIGGLLESGNFNAVACKVEDRYQIGLNWGVLTILKELFCQLLCQKEFLPWAGQIRGSSVVINLKQINLADFDFDEAMATIITDNYDKKYESVLDPSRMHFSTLLTRLSLTIILLHETRHITGGHLDMINHLGPRSHFQEWNQSANDNSTGLTKQFLEKDADEVALYSIHVFLHRMLFDAHPDSVKYDEYKRFINRFSYDRLVELCVVCFEVIFKLFNMKSSPIVEDWTRLTHPPVAVRRSMLLDSFITFLTSGELAGLRFSNQQVTSVFSEVEKYTDDAFRLLFPDYTDGLGLISQNKIYAHKRKLLRISEQTWKNLDSHKYYDTYWDRIRNKRGRYNIGAY